jgi:perosamine synthetase
MDQVRPRPLFVPAYPTLWPHMMIDRSKPAGFQPFVSPSARYFYFARNALWRMVELLGLRQGEVLMPAYHHGVEVEALLAAGASARFYRVGSRWDVDLDDVERKITAKTRALYLTHYAGFPGPAAEMRRLADQHGIPLIEDCALSLLSSDGAVPLGTTGDVAVFCLYKALPVPNGGAMVLNRAPAYDLPGSAPPPRTSTFSHTISSLLQNVELRGGRAGRWIRSAIRGLGRQAVQAGKVKRVATGAQHFSHEHVELGISPLSLKIARAQDLPRIVELRRRNYLLLRERLCDVATILIDELPTGVCPLFFPLLVENKAPLMERLHAKGIESIDFWRDFHPACDPERFPEVVDLRRRVLEIPCHQDLTPDVITRIAAGVREALGDADRSRARR